ncbi:MAG TPA: lmo0937 family membrane protein [Patescibacteria group bacterium]|nr:lmo0937 family membrane protein [Patescibacteria group bacterium]
MGILEIIAVILIIAWLGGFSLHIAGGLIHILLIIAIILIILRFIRRAA